jgi:hypothetical protein
MPSRERARPAPHADALASADRGTRRVLQQRVARLGRAIDRAGADLEKARGRLAQLSAELVGGAPGFRALQTREQVVPFRDAARRYLLEATQLFSGDPRGLARSLGVSYFALRRLLARYDVPFPAARARR